MRLTSITACKATLQFLLDTAFTGSLTLKEYAPVIHGTQRLVAQETISFTEGKAEIIRYAGSHDRIFARYELDGVSGICYVTDFADDAHENIYPYRQPATIKTLDCPHHWAEHYGIRQNRPDVNLPAMVSLHEQPGTIPFEFEGTTYYFYEKELRSFAEEITGYDISTFIVLNSLHGFGSHREPDVIKTCAHPGYEWGDPGAFISAFNMTTEESIRLYGAFIAFLAKYYTPEENPYHLGGVVIGNEITVPRFWGNAGEMAVEDYMEEYFQAMRIAWLCGRKYYSDFRVYVSLNQEWVNITNQPYRIFDGRRILDLMAEIGARDGDFDWHVAHHPYPEESDFWNDRRAPFHFKAQLITYRNMEVLEAYLAQPQFLHKGQPRRIIFSEQGFNTPDGPLEKLREKQGAAGYTLSYLKARNMKTVDMMYHHCFTDNPHEFGLHLGIHHNDPNAPDGVGKARLICDSIRAMDTPGEAAAIAFAREFIGEDMFEYILHPQVFCGDPDTSSETDFGTDQVLEKPE